MRVLAFILALVMSFSAVQPAVAFAVETEPVTVETVPVVETTATETEEPTVSEAATVPATVVTEPAEETTAPASEEEPSEEVTVPETEATEEATVPATEATEEETAPATEETIAEEEMDDASAEEAEEVPESEYGEVTNYADFVKYLKELEVYAEAYAASSSKNKDASLLVINFIRTGVDRYLDGNWKTLAGEEITEFTEYVKAQATANNSEVLKLRNIVIEDFKLPNGNQTDFGHMFGTLNISYVAAELTADLGGWAGDLCDLILYSKNFGAVPAGTIDEKAAFILKNCFGVNADDAFGWDDFYGDMDAFYLNKQVKAGNKLSAIMEAYFTESLSDADRAEFFMENRFSGLLTKEDVREAIYTAYTSNAGLKVLEADRGISGETELREAACYAFADYLFSQAGDRLEGGSEDEEEETPDNEFYTVFSSEESTLAPGITQTIRYAQTADGKQIVYYVATVDVTRDDVDIYANYRDNDPSKGWGMQRVMEQAAALQARHTNPDDAENYIENFNVIVATNADGYNMSTGEPGGLLVMEGKEWHAVDGGGFFAILKDGTAMIGTKDDYAVYKDQIKEAVGGFGATLIKDGKVAVNKSSNYYVSRASRTAIGITASGAVVMMVLDGRQEPFSAGGSMEEIAQIMLDAGCVDAINLDGGGSTTYASKPEGSDSLVLVNRPSDGYQRSVSTSLAAVSTAKVSNEFSHAVISAEYDYLTIGTSVEVSASGVSFSGNAAPIPENAVWQVSDASVGTVANGVFTAAANGDVNVQLVVDGTIVGEKEIHVVVPDALAFEKDAISAIYGVPVNLPLTATYNGNPVAINENDIYTGLEFEEAGTIDGFVFTGNEASGIRTTLVGVLLQRNEDAYAEMRINLYKNGEAVFDFENATAGNRTLAWNRIVTNSTTEDESTYTIYDPKQSMDVSYAFALDMEDIEIPPRLQDLVYMLPGAGTGNDTAWSFLLQLAERVSVLTEVRVTAQFDPDLDVDISELKVVNDYFFKKSATLDEETNTMTLICGWVDQDAAIPAETANPICILSGIKATPRADAKWNADDDLEIVNNGRVSYKIYLRANALYSFAKDPANQAEYALYPFENPDVIIGGATEKGASFSSEYAEFQDIFTLDKTIRQGWYEIDKKMYYFVDHVAVTGIQKVPSQKDLSVSLFYEFDESGVCLGTITGLFEYDGGLCYAIMGEMKKGWISYYDSEGNPADYYFDPYTGKAVNGEVTVEGYNYIFTDYVLTRGDLVTNEKGTRYRWAGLWVFGKWFDVGEDTYHTARYETYVTTGFAHVIGPDLEYGWYLFDENGVFQKHYNGKYDVGADTYLLENGKMIQEPGLVLLEDGYYYYFCSNGKAVKNRVYWPTKTNGLMPIGPYEFDELGRMVNPPVVKPEEPDVPADPTDPSDPADPSEPTEPEDPKPVKDGLVKENGAIYYYRNGVIQYCAGLIEIDGDYYYIRSNGQAAIGNYWVTNNNGIMPSGMYTFDEDGKMVLPGAEEPDTPDTPDEPDTPVEPEPPKPVKDGIVEINGILYYYKNDVLQYCAGLILLDGNYYYVRSNGQLAIGKYWTTNHNDLLPAGLYEFDEDGKMLNPPVVEPEDPDTPDTPDTPDEPDTPVEPEQPAVKNGIVDVNGVLYYYENDVIMYGAGVVQLTDDSGATFYIYVRSNGQLALGNYWPTITNGLIPGNRCYNFGTDGRLYL